MDSIRKKMESVKIEYDVTFTEMTQKLLQKEAFYWIQNIFILYLCIFFNRLPFISARYAV